MGSKKNQIIPREVNSVVVEQRATDGFINGTTMCTAHEKEINDRLTTRDTFELFMALAVDLGIEVKDGDFRDLDVSRLSATKYVQMFSGLIVSKRGSPETGGGTWLHPDLAVQLAQWCNKPFAIQVSRWIREWVTTGNNPIASQADLDRIAYRLGLKDEARIRMTGEVKKYLETIKRYDDRKYAGIYFARVHDAINLAITGETAKQMRERLKEILKREIKESDLIRDYFPAMELQRYIAVCEAAANLMVQEDMNPLEAVSRACQLFLPMNYVAKPIDFIEHIKFVQGRVNLQIIGHEQKKLIDDITTEN